MIGQVAVYRIVGVCFIDLVAGRRLGSEPGRLPEEQIEQRPQVGQGHACWEQH